MNYTDFQVSFQDRATLIARTFNAQRARNRGIEVEFNCRPTSNIRLGGSLTYLHARYREFTFPGGAVYTYGNSNYCPPSAPMAQI